MDINPIPYSAFVKEDDSIQKLINQLTDLQNKYVDLLGVVKSSASDTKKALVDTNSATAEGQSAVNAASLGAQRLKRLQEELKLALSDTGKEIAVYKDKLADATKENSLNAKQILAGSQSLKQIKSELAQLIKQYENLSAEERVNGTDTQILTERILNLRQEVKNITSNITAQTKVTTNQAKANDVLAMATQKLIKAYSDETAELFKIKRETDEVLKIKKLEARAADGTIASYNRLAAEYELNMINLNKYSQATINSSRFLSRQQEESKKLRLEMIRLKEATGNHALSVGNYTKAWNGLGMATQQVVRELPAMAISTQTFFIAISNNIPILADEIRNLAAQNKLAAAAGRETTSVWRQLGKSLFSWQTMLVLSLTLLSLFGGKIVKWIGDLFKGEKAVGDLAEAQKALNKEMADNSTGIGDNTVKIKTLSEEWKKLGGDIKAQEKFIKDNTAEFNSLGISINTVSEAQLALVENTQLVIEALKLQARATAAGKLAAAEYELAAKEERKLQQLQEQGPSTAARTKGTIVSVLGTAARQSGAGGMYLPSQNEIVSAEEAMKSFHAQELKQTEENIANHNREGDAYMGLKTMADLAAEAKIRAAGLKSSDGTVITDTGTNAEARNQSVLSIEEENLKIRQRYAESVTDLEYDELEKQKKQLQDAFNAESAELLNKQKNDERLTKENKQLINDIVYNMQLKLNHDLEMLDIDWQQRQLNYEKEGLDLRLSLMEQGTMEYYDVRNQLLRNQMDYEILENKKQIATLRKDEQAIRNKYAYDILQNEIAMDDIFFKQAQDYEKSEFEMMRHSEYEKEKFRLQQEKAMWTRRLEMAKGGLLQLSALEIATIENTIKGLDLKLGDLNRSRDVFDILGLELDDDQKNAISEATGFVKDNISAIIDSELQLAELKLNKAKEQVDKAYEFLKLEMEARNEGYANNVDTARKELQLAQENEKKALMQRKQAQLAQSRIDTLEQTSSLITASANIWKTFSTMGPFGIPAAVAAIALMFGSFIGAKVRANQVITENAEEYAEGHVELLEGGSHKSGRDISLGKTKNGKERKAEGGEIFAVVNKRSVHKYGTDKIFDVVTSINKGIFEDKYTKIFSPINYAVNSQTGNIDLLDIDSNVKAIRDEASYKYFNDSNGLLVEKYKNRTRTFRR